MNHAEGNEISVRRRFLWCGVIALVGTAATFIRIPTTLGIRVPETNIQGIDPDLIDTSGRESIWRVWWRARSDLVTYEPQWLVTLGLLALLTIFASGVILAVWFALAPNPASDDSGE